MITKDLNLKRRSTHCVLSFILQRCKFENKNIVKIEQTYIAQETLYSRQTVSTELKYLQEQGYITYKRALFNNLKTTEITLTEKSIALISRPQETQIKPQNKTIKTEETQPQADVPKPQNKPQNKPIKTEPSQPQAEDAKAQNKPQNEPIKTAPKQVETEQHEITLTPIQRGCLIALERAVKRGGSYPEFYVDDALQQGVPQELINNILKKRYSNEI